MPMGMKMEENLKRIDAYKEVQAYSRHNTIAGLVAAVWAAISFHFIWPLHMLLLATELSWNARFGYAGEYFSNLLGALLAQHSYFELLDAYYIQWIGGMFTGAYAFSFMVPAWFGTILVIIAVGLATNAHSRTPNIFGDARWATEDDIEAMEGRNLVGFFDTDPKSKGLFVIGKFQKKLVRMGETLSILLLAPPGTGKSVGFIVPSALTMDNACLFFHDQKPELFDMTSGWRAKLGPVFQLKWGAQDEPNGTWVTDDQSKLLAPALLEKDENGELVRDESGFIKTKPIYYPSWNPLSPKSIPAPGPRRDMYIDRLVNVLLPDNPGGDKFWTSKGRAALVGLIHYLVAKVECATNPDMTGSWTGIPEQWHSKEASFPMLLDWFSYAQIEFDDGSEDPMRQLFKSAADEARNMDKEFDRVFGVRALNRAVNELVSLMNSPDKTRGSILATVDEAFNPFKNEAVRQRTANSDFAFNELRGVPTPEAKAREAQKVEDARKAGRIYKPRYSKDEFLPISIYISINLEDAKAFSVITGIFVDSVNAYLVANGPNAIDDQGNQVGPYDFGFLLDECPQLPKLETVVNGPSVGRSKRVFYVIVGQDYGQFEQKYSRPDVESLNSNTAIKIILSQNNEKTAKTVSEMAGKITYKSSSESGGKSPIPGSLGKLFSKKSTTDSWQSVEFLKVSDIMSMPQDKHVVLVQNFMNRPIRLTTPKFFLEDDIKAKAYNLRDFSGLAPTTPMPLSYIEEADTRHNSHREAEEVKANPRHVVIVTPRDIQHLGRNDDTGELPDRRNIWAAFAADITDDTGYIEDPLEEQIFVTEDVAELAEFVGKTSRYFVFTDEYLESEINAPLREKGLPGLNPEYAISLAKRAYDANETMTDDIHSLGRYGTPNLDPPAPGNAISGVYAVRWAVEILTHILGIEEQKRMYEWVT